MRDDAWFDRYEEERRDARDRELAITYAIARFMGVALVTCAVLVSEWRACVVLYLCALPLLSFEHWARPGEEHADGGESYYRTLIQLNKMTEK